MGRPCSSALPASGVLAYTGKDEIPGQDERSSTRRNSGEITGLAYELALVTPSLVTILRHCITLYYP